ncbi:sigma-54 dependent transcriptional regulator [Myxococcota bacterium]|nr:sigma-54 dependent transcriptional regulator [Myxococcota bacterium]MBU1534959.1 sigma-54 dependent transcriptional regulator [Myxococcota bacterium]
MKPSILVVDDEQSILESIERLLLRESYAVFKTDSAEDAITIIQKEHISLLLTDLRLPKMSGIDLLKVVRRIAPATEIILMTAFGSVEVAVTAMKEGAYDFITKPIKRAILLKTISKALEKQKLVSENQELRRLLNEKNSDRLLVGNSTAFRQTRELIAQVAQSEAHVLIFGESGTGKEMAAQSLHQNSPRRAGPFVPVNCAALPESIIESELFGYVRGAFTGAENNRQGRFAKAHGGTLFLDEIGELSQNVQVKLLRILQEGMVEPLGSDKPVKTDFRLICATHKDLKEEVKQGRFREDLYYRLHVISIRIPPLRERMEDIPLLATHFIERANLKNHREVLGIDPGALDVLTSHDWPGNVRELENIMERAVVLTRNEILTIEDLPPELHGSPHRETSINVPLGLPLEEVERRLIRETLKLADGNKKDAARILGIAVRTIYRRIAEDTDLLE